MAALKLNVSGIVISVDNSSISAMNVSVCIGHFEMAANWPFITCIDELAGGVIGCLLVLILGALGYYLYKQYHEQVEDYIKRFQDADAHHKDPAKCEKRSQLPAYIELREKEFNAAFRSAPTLPRPLPLIKREEGFEDDVRHSDEKSPNFSALLAAPKQRLCDWLWPCSKGLKNASKGMGYKYITNQELRKTEKDIAPLAILSATESIHTRRLARMRHMYLRASEFAHVHALLGASNAKAYKHIHTLSVVITFVVNTLVLNYPDDDELCMQAAILMVVVGGINTWVRYADYEVRAKDHRIAAAAFKEVAHEIRVGLFEEKDPEEVPPVGNEDADKKKKDEADRAEAAQPVEEKKEDEEEDKEVRLTELIKHLPAEAQQPVDYSKLFIDIAQKVFFFIVVQVPAFVLHFVIRHLRKGWETVAPAEAAEKSDAEIGGSGGSEEKENKWPAEMLLEPLLPKTSGDKTDKTKPTEGSDTNAETVDHDENNKKLQELLMKSLEFRMAHREAAQFCYFVNGMIALSFSLGAIVAGLGLTSASGFREGRLGEFRDDWAYLGLVVSGLKLLQSWSDFTQLTAQHRRFSHSYSKLAREISSTIIVDGDGDVSKQLKSIQTKYETLKDKAPRVAPPRLLSWQKGEDGKALYVHILDEKPFDTAEFLNHFVVHAFIGIPLKWLLDPLFNVNQGWRLDVLCKAFTDAGLDKMSEHIPTVAGATGGTLVDGMVKRVSELWNALGSAQTAAGSEDDGDGKDAEGPLLPLHAAMLYNSSLLPSPLRDLKEKTIKDPTDEPASGGGFAGLLAKIKLGPSTKAITDGLDLPHTYNDLMAEMDAALVNQPPLPNKFHDPAYPHHKFVHATHTALLNDARRLAPYENNEFKSQVRALKMTPSKSQRRLLYLAIIYGRACELRDVHQILSNQYQRIYMRLQLASVMLTAAAAIVTLFSPEERTMLKRNLTLASGLAATLVVLIQSWNRFRDYERRSMDHDEAMSEFAAIALKTEGLFAKVQTIAAAIGGKQMLEALDEIETNAQPKPLGPLWNAVDDDYKKIREVEAEQEKTIKTMLGEGWPGEGLKQKWHNRWQELKEHKIDENTSGSDAGLTPEQKAYAKYMEPHLLFVEREGKSNHDEGTDPLLEVDTFAKYSRNWNEADSLDNGLTLQRMYRQVSEYRMANSIMFNQLWLEMTTVQMFLLLSNTVSAWLLMYGSRFAVASGVILIVNSALTTLYSFRSYKSHLMRHSKSIRGFMECESQLITLTQASIPAQQNAKLDAIVGQVDAVVKEMPSLPRMHLFQDEAGKPLFTFITRDALHADARIRYSAMCKLAGTRDKLVCPEIDDGTYEKKFKEELKKTLKIPSQAELDAEYREKVLSDKIISYSPSKRADIPTDRFEMRSTIAFMAVEEKEFKGQLDTLLDKMDSHMEKMASQPSVEEEGSASSDPDPKMADDINKMAETFELDPKTAEDLLSPKIPKMERRKTLAKIIDDNLGEACLQATALADAELSKKSEAEPAKAQAESAKEAAADEKSADP